MDTQSHPIDSRTYAIGVLGITACVLLVGLLLITGQPTPAYGIGQNDRGGDYIILTQQLTSSNEGLVVVDAAAKKMILYGFDYNQKALRILDGFNLNNLKTPQDK